MRVVYDSITGQGLRFTTALGYPMVAIDQCEPAPYEKLLLVTRTHKFGEIPPSTQLFLDAHAAHVAGVAVGGNRNWGINYGAAGDKIAAQYGIPLVCKFEAAGMPSERAMVKAWLDEHS
jgi:protein involved in ribonucleotide reduction